MYQYTDRRNRTLADRVNEAAERRLGQGTEQDKGAVTALLADMLNAAAQHGITLDVFDWVADLPGNCYAAVVSPLHARTTQWATAG
ncbi:hypothetical protein ACFVUY_28525 [Kitasatospora sp. NPDC058063]|uniref:hypothetical protein n=1 Tax=unclassified Kitasatospora TaxID=2633591 RepID=UPI0036DA6EEA